MNRACFTQNANLQEQNQRVSCIRPIKSNFVRMKVNVITKTIVILSLLVFEACNSGSTKNPASLSTDTLSNASTEISEVIGKDGGIPIFYNMYLSVEMSSLFQSISATYNEKMLNAPERVVSYNTSTTKALNLGVYAVDLSYAKYFDQFQSAGKYLKNMHKLAVDLGIPDDKFILSVKRIEINLTNKDSMVKIANELYTTTEDYLKKSDRGSAAALIIAGGWIEALYIATNMVNLKAKDIVLIERIADQKNSLDNLIALLKNYENEKIIKEYLTKLFELKASFAKFNVNEKNMDDTYKQLNDISIKIHWLRKEVVS